MTKINREEYEILKGLDDNWKWIARDRDGLLYAFELRPFKDNYGWLWRGDSDFSRINKSGFQFIQWEDPEPYNISELIEEYEREAKDKETDLYTRRMKFIAQVISDLNSESEETEVKKNLKEAILGIEVTQFDGQKADLEELVNPKQLEKIISDWMPEVLTDKWIDKHVVYADVRGGTQAFIRVDDLQNLLVPKQEELTDEQIARKVDQAYKDGYEKGKEHATEKERETVGSVFVDFLLASAKLKLALAMEVEELEE